MLPVHAPVLTAPLRQVLITGQALPPIELPVAALAPYPAAVYRFIQASPVQAQSGVVLGVELVLQHPSDLPAGSFSTLADMHNFEHLLFMQAPIGVLISNMQGQLLYVNPAFCRLTGYRREELLDLKAADLTHPDDRTADQRIVARILAGHKQTAQNIKRYRHKDGHEIWVQITRSLIRDHTGIHQFGLAFIEDISERIRAIEALQRSEAMFSAAFNNGPIILAITRLSDGRIIEVNERFLAITGYSREEVIERTPLELALWVDPQQRFEGLRHLHQGQTVRESEADFRMKDGSIRTCLLFATMLELHGEKSVLTALTDITERRRAELERAQLVEENVRLYTEERQARAIAEDIQRRSMFLAEASQLLTDSLDYDVKLARITRLVVPFLADYSLLYAVTPEGRYRQVAIAHIDATKEPLLQELGERYDLDMTNPHSILAQVIRTGTPALGPELSPRTARAITHEPRLLEIYAILNPTAYLVVPLIVAGKVTGALSLVTAESGRHYDERDLALAQEIAQRAAIALDNARLYREAQKAISIRDEFFSIASHELKTPLTALLGQAQLLQRRFTRDPLTDERHHRSVQTIATQAARLDGLITELLDVARIERGQFELVRTPVDLAALVREVAHEMEMIDGQHTVRCTVPELPLMVLGDAARLEQVVQNLIQNALKYSPAGSEVVIRAQQVETTVQVVVRDAGIGIPATALPLLFDRFYRVQNSATAGISGMGVGLYIVKEIVALHEGTVVVDSAEGAGSTFTVTLPALGEHP
jgi:PAS domain S-box-containing protein